VAKALLPKIISVIQKERSICVTEYIKFSNIGYTKILIGVKKQIYYIQGDQKSLCTWRSYCNRQMHRDFLLTLYKYAHTKTYITYSKWRNSRWHQI